MSPIFEDEAYWAEHGSRDGAPPKECENVHRTMPHLLWGPEWDDPEKAASGAKGEWYPIDGYEDPSSHGPNDPWEPVMNCSKSYAKDKCIVKAEQLCDTAFNRTLHKSPNKPEIDRLGALSLILVVMAVAYAYAFAKEKNHRERVQARMIKRLQRSQKLSEPLAIPDGSAESNAKDNSPGSIVPEELVGTSMPGEDVVDAKAERFFKLLVSTNNDEIAGTLQWWDCNFLEQEMEDMFRRALLLKSLLTFRVLIVGGLFVVFGYQATLGSSRVKIYWEMRVLLAVFSFSVVPFTFKERYERYQAFSEMMFSNIMIFVSTIFLIIAYLDKYSGSPTANFLLMGIIIMFQILIMYVTGTVWFRKMLINLGVLLVYIVIARISVRDCIGYDQYLNHPEEDPKKGEGMQIGTENLYPAIQILPDYDSFKLHMSCTDKTEEFDFLKQIGFACVVWFITAYTGYQQEKEARVEFGKKWKLMKTKSEMEKKLKNLQEKQMRSKEKRQLAFGEMREIKFMSPMNIVLTTIEKIKVAVGDDDLVIDALKTIEETLQNNEDLNKVDIQKQDLTDKDKELAQFVMSTGGNAMGARDRARSVPSILSDGIDSEKIRGENALITQIGLPDGQLLIGSKQVEMLDYLNKFEDWNFDTHLFSLMSSGRPIYYLLLKHLDKYTDYYDFDLDALKSFAIHIEDSYCYDPTKRNAYHNNLHGADVMQTVGCLIKHKFVNGKLGNLEKLTSIVTALCHDYRHKGVNNAFLVNTNDVLALTHNDQSVLERFHASEMFITLKNGHNGVNMNFLECLSTEDYKHFRSSSIDMILATDLSVGYKYITKFKNYKEKGIEQWGNKPDDILILMQMCLKVADVSHPSKELKAHKAWSVMITEEFYYQGDLEKERGLAPSPLCDRVKNFDIPKSQTGFIDFVVSPTIKDIATMLEITEILDNLKSNYMYWSTRHEEHVQADTLKQSYKQMCDEVEADNKERSSSALLHE